MAWRSLILFCLLCTGVVNAETGQPLWRFAHPNAKSLIGMDLRRIQQSGVARTFEKTWLEGIAGKLPGLELLDQIDQVLISSPGSATLDATSDPPVLIVVRGHFDPVKVRQLLREQGAKPQIFAGVEIFRPQTTRAMEFGFSVLDASTIIAGDAQSIFSCIERMRLPQGEPASGITARAESLKLDYDFWLVMTEPGALRSVHLPISSLVQSGLMQGVNGIELGVSFRQGLLVTGSLLMISEYDARDLKEEFNKLLKLLAKDQATKPELAQLGKKLKLEVDASAVRFSLRMSKPDLDASLRKVKIRHPGKESVLVETLPTLPEKPQLIRIEGLDGGTREIKYPATIVQPR